MSTATHHDTTNPPISSSDTGTHSQAHPSRPVTPVRGGKIDHLINSPSHSLLLLASGPPSPVPRDDIIEGMSASTSSIFERDVEFLEPILTAHEAIELAIPSVLDEAIEALTTTDPDQIILESPSSLSTPSPRKRPVLSFESSPISTHTSSLPQQWDSPLTSNGIPGLHHQLSDSMSISDPSSPRSLSPTPSLNQTSIVKGFNQILGEEPDQKPSHIRINNSSDPNHINHSARLSFMSYADLINSERSNTSPLDYPSHYFFTPPPSLSPTRPSPKYESPVPLVEDLKVVTNE